MEYTSDRAKTGIIDYVHDEVFINFEYIDGPIGFRPIKMDFPDITLNTKLNKGWVVSNKIQWNLIKRKPTNF